MSLDASGAWMDAAWMDAAWMGGFVDLAEQPAAAATVEIGAVRLFGDWILMADRKSVV